MNRWFGTEGILQNVFGKIFDLLILNLCFLFSCLPVVTIGAAQTALFAVNLKAVRLEEGNVFQEYRKAFREKGLLAIFCAGVPAAAGGIGPGECTEKEGGAAVMARKKKLFDQNYTKTTFAVQILMTIVVGLFALPIFMIFNYSFKTKKELYLGSPFDLPESLNFENYVKAFDRLDLTTTFLNTLFYTVVSVLILAMLCGVTAWAIARCRHRFFKFAYVYFLVGILIPYQALFLPIYTIGYRMGLTNTRFGIIFMYVATGISFGVFLMNSFMSTVPLELEESARIDGCSVIRTYISVVMPLLKPAMATLIIMQSFQIWNDYLVASLYVSNNKLKTLTVAIHSLFSAQSSDYNTAFAAIVISVLPIVILFLSLQKYFIKGMTVGAVKG